VPVVRPTVIQSWAHALNDGFVRPGSPLANLMEQWDVTFVAFSPLAQGRLLDKYNPNQPPQFEEGDNRHQKPTFQPEPLPALKPKIEKIKECFGSTTEDLAAVALQYILAQPRVSCVIPGFRNERQAACNVAGASRSLSQDDLEFIRTTLQTA